MCWIANRFNPVCFSLIRTISNRSRCEQDPQVILLPARLDAGVLHRWPECCTAGCCLSSLLRCLRWALFVKYLVEVVLFSSIGAVGGEREERGVLSWTGGGARGAFMSGRKSEGCFYVAGRARGAFMDGRKSEGCVYVLATGASCYTER